MSFGTRAVTVLTLSLTMFAPVALAKGPSEKTITACRADYNKFCPAYSVGTPELTDCMTKAGQRKSLSPKCLQSLIDDGLVPRKYLR